MTRIRISLALTVSLAIGLVGYVASAPDRRQPAGETGESPKNNLMYWPGT